MDIWNDIFYKPLLNSLVLLYSYIPFAKLGLAIILLTVIIRIILFPLTLQSIKQQESLKKFQPEMEKLKKKYSKDKERYQKELIKFYSEKKINPVLGCLPILIQMPIIIALYQVFSFFNDSNLEAINQLLYKFVPQISSIIPTFIIWDLSKPDQTYILAILAGVTQFIQTKMTLTNPTEQSQKIMNQIAYLMPLMIVFFSAGLPAALPLYWIVSTIVAILQTWLIQGKKKNGA